MKILVSVAETAELGDDFEIDGHSIDDRYFGYSLNEWDDYALEEAVQLAEDGVADEVVTVSIGSDRSEETIREALAKGADRAIRVWDESLEDVDVLSPEAKAQILAAIAQEEDPDMIFMGVQTADSGWGATGVSLATELDFSWGAVVTNLDLDTDENVARVHRELEGGIHEVTEIDTPAVLTIQTGINEPRYASLRGIRQAQKKELAVKSLGDIGLDLAALDSRITMTELYEPETEGEATIWDGEPDEEAAELGSFLEEKEGIEV
jgi:electron transfer flavoprotein beta subunit